MKLKTLISVALILIALCVAFTVRAQTDQVIEKPLVVVHRFEAHALQFNPLTHEVSQQEQADGNVILSIRPKQVAPGVQF